ncbi:MAG TPA: GNAT family N-acetyltransferase [Abditibacterium sp.]|jgi:GNAT superfamily N-acetyltransferase
MTIRAAQSADIPALLSLLELLFALEADFVFDENKARRGLEMMLENAETRRVLVAEIDGEVAGMCSAQLVVSTAMGAHSAWVEDVVLAPQFRGRGVMPQMLAQLEKWAVSQGATRFQLLCDAHNAPALAFYEKQDFQPTQLVCFFKFSQ